MYKMLLFVALGMGIAAIIAYVINKKKRAETDRQKAREDAVTGANVTNDITRVGKGGVLRMPPFGTNRLPIETYVETRHRYQDPDGGPAWYELVCQHGKREMVVEWSREGGEIYISAGYEDENPRLEDIGLDEGRLIEFDENERGHFEYDGQKWHYVESGERLYAANDGRSTEGFYCWEFESDDESRNLTIEKWEGDRKFHVYHLWMVDARAVEVFDAGEGK